MLKIPRRREAWCAAKIAFHPRVSSMYSMRYAVDKGLQRMNTACGYGCQLIAETSLIYTRWHALLLRSRTWALTYAYSLSWCRVMVQTSPDPYKLA